MAQEKNAGRPLMRQKTNITPAIIEKWVYEYKFDIRHVIHESQMKEEDLGAKFKHNDREFEIVGMGNMRTIMLRETREEGVFYWEASRHFVQMKLERFNREYVKLPNGKTRLVNMLYTDNQLLLPPKNNKRKTKSKDEEIPEDELETVLIDNVVIDEIADETTEIE